MINDAPNNDISDISTHINVTAVSEVFETCSIVSSKRNCYITLGNVYVFYDNISEIAFSSSFKYGTKY